MNLRKILFWGHLSAGIAAGLLILNASVTGLMIAFEHQIVEFAERGVRRVAPPADGGAPLSADDLLAGAAASAPGKRATALTVSSDPRASASVQFGRDGAVFVDPYTGAALGGESWIHGALHAVEDWHRWLWAREPGRMITGAACLVFVAMILSGIVLWWPRKWGMAPFKAVSRYNPRLKGRERDWNWHNVTGFWCAPFLLVMSLTGVIMSYDWANDLLFRAMGSEPPPRRAAPAAPGGMRGGEKREEPPLPSFTPLLAKARAQLPVWDTITLRAPRKAGDPVTATISEPSGVGPLRRSSLSLDAATAEVLKWEPYAEASPGRKARTWARYLHTGEVFGWPGQLVAFIASAGALLLVWTGLALSWRRFFARRPPA